MNCICVLVFIFRSMRTAVSYTVMVDDETGDIMTLGHFVDTLPRTSPHIEIR